MRLFDTPAQLLIGVIMAAAAFLAATSRGRLRAVMLAGVTGYGMAVLFLLHGAPDLALTQTLVETVTLVIFALVLRKLPKYFTTRPLQATRWWRLVVAVTAGTVVALVGLAASGARVAVPVSEAFYEAAYTFGYGYNIVNVTLVDIRAWDTLGEIAVLVVAATGVASLIFIRSRYPELPTRPSVRAEAGGTGRMTWLRGGETLSPLRRSIIFEVVTRVLFPVMIVVSVYLLIAGHNAPGGGFAGGLVAGMALVIRYLAAGSRELDEAAPVDAGRVLGAGLLLAGAERAGPAALRWPDPAELRHQRRLRPAGRGGDPARPAGGAGVAAPGHLGVLRHRGLPRRHRRDAGPGPQPRLRHRPARDRGPGARAAQSPPVLGHRRHRGRRGAAPTRGGRPRGRRMSPNLTLVLISGVLVAAGVYLMLERSLTRILVGVLLASNGVNVMFLVASGAAGGAPIIGVTPKQEMSDPLPQAMVLTAIVITLGTTAYLLALAYRSFQLNGHDEVADDVEDAAIRRLAEADLASDSYDADIEGHPDEVGQGIGDEEGERVPPPDPEAEDAPEVPGGREMDADAPTEPDAAADTAGDQHRSPTEAR